MQAPAAIAQVFPAPKPATYARNLCGRARNWAYGALSVGTRLSGIHYGHLDLYGLGFVRVVAGIFVQTSQLCLAHCGGNHRGGLFAALAYHASLFKLGNQAGNRDGMGLLRLSAQLLDPCGNLGVVDK